MKKTITEQLRELGLNPKQIKKIFNYYNHNGYPLSKHVYKASIEYYGGVEKCVYLYEECGCIAAYPFSRIEGIK